MPATAREKRADARRNVEAILEAALACLIRDPEANIGDIANIYDAGQSGRDRLGRIGRRRRHLGDAAVVEDNVGERPPRVHPGSH